MIIAVRDEFELVFVQIDSFQEVAHLDVMHVIAIFYGHLFGQMCAIVSRIITVMVEISVVFKAAHLIVGRGRVDFAKKQTIFVVAATKFVGRC